MDYLVAGLGFGALLVLAGYATREFGLFLFVPTRIRKTFSDNPTLADGWRRLCRVASNVAMVGGVIMWLALVVAIAFAVSDRTGAYLVASVATVVSLAGAAVIFRVFQRLHLAAITGHADTSLAAAGWQESDVRAEDTPESFETWKPRILPKPVDVIAAEVSVQDAAPETPRPDDGEVTPEGVAAAVGGETPPAFAGTPPETLTSEVTAVAMAATADPSRVGEEEAPAVGADASPVEPIEAVETTVEPVHPPDTPAPQAPAPGVAAEAAAVEPEPVELEPAGETKSDRVSEDESGPAAETAVGARRFKSSLLSNLDESDAVDANAKFKSSILADLSAVRLPDDGPRFHSTTLIDVASPEETEADPGESNGVATHHQ